MERDFGFSMPIDESLQSINHISIAPVLDAALHGLELWTREGAPPLVQPRIDFAGDPPAIVRDANGIARGGIRLPQVEVPVAHNSAIQRTPDVFGRLVGSYEPFSVEKVRDLYGSPRELLCPLPRGSPAPPRPRRSCFRGMSNLCLLRQRRTSPLRSSWSNPQQSTRDTPKSSSVSMTTEVILTGTGVPYPAPGRAGAGTFVRSESVALQFDAGRGTVMRLTEAGRDSPSSRPSS